MRKKFFVNLLAVAAVVMVGSFRAFGLDVAHGPLAMLAAAAAPYALQTKILIIAGGVYGLLQGLKKAGLPLNGIWAVAFNLGSSILGVITLVQPQDLLSTQTISAVLIAAAGAAGVHGTIRSFSGGNSGSAGNAPSSSSTSGSSSTASTKSTSSTSSQVLKLATLACAGIALGFTVAGCSLIHKPGQTTPSAPLDQVARNTLATSSGVLNQAQVEYLAECSANPTTKTCTLINQAGAAQNAALTTLETYCGFANTAVLPAADAECHPVASFESALVTATANLQELVGEVKGVISPQPAASPSPQPAAKQ